MQVKNSPSLPLAEAYPPPGWLCGSSALSSEIVSKVHESSFSQTLKGTHDPKHAKDNWEKSWNIFEGCKPERVGVRFIIYVEPTDLQV